MNEEHSGWSEPAEEKVEDDGGLGEQPLTEAPPNPPDGELEGEQEKSESENDSETPPDPLDEFRKDGKLFGRYDSEVDALKAFHANDTERGRLAAEVGQLRQQLMERQAAQPEGVDLEALAPLVGQLPSQIVKSQAFWDYATKELGMQPPTDEEGYIDLDSVNPADLIVATQKMAEYVKSGTEAQQQQAVFEQHRAITQAFQEQFYTAHPELKDIDPLVDAVFGELYLSRQWTSEELDAALVAGVKDRIMKIAPVVLGQRGGQAAAEARRVPPGALPGSNGLSATGARQSEDDKYRGWAPPAIVKEAGGKTW